MSADWMIVFAEPAHVPPLAAHMREADRREVWASHRHSPEQALEWSLAFAVRAWTCFVDNEPAFMWGVSRPGSILSLVGAPWLLGTEAMLKVRREFLRQSRAYVELMQQDFERLENKAHAGNRESLRWLRWCGFEMDERPETIRGEPFVTFWRVRPCAA